MRKKRYVIRLHKAIRLQMDILARQQGYLTPTYISKILENVVPGLDIPYRIQDTEEIFQLKNGGMEKGSAASADRQMSVYLNDVTYERIGEITRWLKENVNKKIGPAYLIRDILYGVLEQDF